MQLSVSVIIPCYNVENYIRDAVNSVFLQGNAIAQLICVDDRSTDKTSSILNELMELHAGKMMVLANETNQGAAFSRNRGLEMASGDYIQFLDADDFLLEGKIDHQLKICVEQSLLPGFVIADYRRKNVSGKESVIVAECEDVWYGLMQTRLGCTCSNLWRRENLVNVGGFDIHLKSSQEYNLMFRLLQAGATTVYDAKPLTMVRDREEGSISSLNRGANWKRFVELRCNVISFLETSGQLTEVRRKKFLQILFDAIRCWYPFSPKEALETYRKFIPSDFTPSTTLVTSGNYVRLFKLFGFRIAEWIKSWRSKK